eukprot:10373_1
MSIYTERYQRLLAHADPISNETQLNIIQSLGGFRTYHRRVMKLSLREYEAIKLIIASDESTLISIEQGWTFNDDITSTILSYSTWFDNMILSTVSWCFRIASWALRPTTLHSIETWSKPCKTYWKKVISAWSTSVWSTRLNTATFDHPFARSAMGFWSIILKQLIGSKQQLIAPVIKQIALLIKHNKEDRVCVDWLTNIAMCCKWSDEHELEPIKLFSDCSDNKDKYPIAAAIRMILKPGAIYNPEKAVINSGGNIKYQLEYLTQLDLSETISQGTMHLLDAGLVQSLVHHLLRTGTPTSLNPETTKDILRHMGNLSSDPIIGKTIIKHAIASPLIEKLHVLYYALSAMDPTLVQELLKVVILTLNDSDPGTWDDGVCENCAALCFGELTKNRDDDINWDQMMTVLDGIISIGNSTQLINKVLMVYSRNDISNMNQIRLLSIVMDRYFDTNEPLFDGIVHNVIRYLDTIHLQQPKCEMIYCIRLLFAINHLKLENMVGFVSKIFDVVYEERLLDEILLFHKALHGVHPFLCKQLLPQFLNVLGEMNINEVRPQTTGINVLITWKNSMHKDEFNALLNSCNSFNTKLQALSTNNLYTNLIDKLHSTS